MIITLIRAEGPTDECSKPVRVESFFDADLKLRHWSHTAPKGGAYDKVDFKIEVSEDVPAYSGRYDLKHWHTECANIKAHVVSWLEHRQANPRSSEGDRDVAGELLKIYKEAK